MQYPSKYKQKVFDIIADRALLGKQMLEDNKDSFYLTVDTELLVALCSGYLSLSDTELDHRTRFVEHLATEGVH